jgi:hypothetical protein
MRRSLGSSLPQESDGEPVDKAVSTQTPEIPEEERPLSCVQNILLELMVLGNVLIVVFAGFNFVSRPLFSIFVISSSFDSHYLVTYYVVPLYSDTLPSQSRCTDPLLPADDPPHQ